MTVNHCEEGARLRELYTALVSGRAEKTARFGEDEVEFHSGNPAALLQLVQFHEGMCSGQRRRFAVRGKFKPY